MREKDTMGSVGVVKNYVKCLVGFRAPIGD